MSYQDSFTKKLEQIAPGIASNPGGISQLSDDLSHSVLRELLGYACEAQNWANICLGREFLARISSDVLVAKLPTAIATINLADDWEYLRLMEMLEIACPNLLPMYVEIGLSSDNPEVREVAREYERFQP